MTTRELIALSRKPKPLADHDDRVGGCECFVKAECWWSVVVAEGLSLADELDDLAYARREYLVVR